MTSSEPIFEYVGTGGVFPEYARLFRTATPDVFMLEVHDAAVARQCEDGAHFVDGPIARTYLHQRDLDRLLAALLTILPDKPTVTGRPKSLLDDFDVVSRQPEDEHD